MHKTAIYVHSRKRDEHYVTADPPPDPPHGVIHLRVTSAEPVELPVGPLTADQLNDWTTLALARAVRVEWGNPAREPAGQ